MSSCARGSEVSTCRWPMLTHLDEDAQLLVDRRIGVLWGLDIVVEIDGLCIIVEPDSFSPPSPELLVRCLVCARGYFVSSGRQKAVSAPISSCSCSCSGR
jgi:hypothetical protein